MSGNNNVSESEAGNMEKVEANITQIEVIERADDKGQSVVEELIVEGSNKPDVPIAETERSVKPTIAVENTVEPSIEAETKPVELNAETKDVQSTLLAQQNSEGLAIEPEKQSVKPIVEEKKPESSTIKANGCDLKAEQQFEEKSAEKGRQPNIEEKLPETFAVGPEKKLNSVMEAAKSVEATLEDKSVESKIVNKPLEPEVSTTVPDSTTSTSNPSIKSHDVDDNTRSSRTSSVDVSDTCAEKNSNSANSETTDGASVVSLAGSKEPGDLKCFTWMKKYGSPKQIMSKLMPKKLRSSSSSSPQPPKPEGLSLEAPHDFGPPCSGRLFEQTFIGYHTHPPCKVERIDYANLAEEKIIPVFLGAHPCYDVMPTSGKVIVLSVDLLVKNAFSALVSNDIKAAPLWDSSIFDFVGMLTITDFISVLRHYYQTSPEDIKDIENQSIATWRRITKISKPFVKLNGSESLAQATKLLIQEEVHRLPVFDEKRQCVLFVLTRRRLLNFLSYSLFEKFENTNVKTPSFFKKTIRELKVGTYEDIAKVKLDSRIIDTLDLFAKRKVSALPVVNEEGVLQDIFEKFDVFQLAKEQTYHNLDIPISEAISNAGNRELAWICTLDESFGTVINRFVNNKVHRIVVIDERRMVVGMISLSDVLKFLVLQPLENSVLSSATETIEESVEGAVGGTTPESQLEEPAIAEEPKSAAAAEVSVAEGVAGLNLSED